MVSNLLLKLSESLQLAHSSHFIRLPHQTYQEPIDYLLESSLTGSSPKKDSLKESPAGEQKERKTSRLFKPMLDLISDSPVTSPSKNAKNDTANKSIIHESAQKVHCIKIPIKLESNHTNNNTIVSQTLNSGETVKHSYSIAFMLRFDDNLIKFSKSYGLNTQKLNSRNAAFESYAHLFSINLDNELSTVEIWLNPNGNLLFIRRSDQSIIITFNFVQIKSNVWHFIHVSYTEEQYPTKLNCKISYSINLADIVHKDFEIFNDLEKNAQRFSR
jgi:hypothetical protein